MRFLHSRVFAVVLSVLLSASAAPQLYAQAQWDVEVRSDSPTNSLTIKKGETVTYDLRLSRPPTEDHWWVVVFVDGAVRDAGRYKGLRWVPSVGREFDRSDWSQDGNNNPYQVPGPWRDIWIQADDTDDVVPGTTVTFTHEVWCPASSICPAGNSDTVTVTIEGASGGGPGGGDGNTGDSSGEDDDSSGEDDDGSGDDDDGAGGDDGGAGEDDDGAGDDDDGAGEDDDGAGEDDDGAGDDDDGAGEDDDGAGDDDDDNDHDAVGSSRNTVGWLRSFGAMVSSHVMDAVDDRMQCVWNRRFGGASPGHRPSGWRCGPRDPETASLVVGGRRLLGGVARADDSASQRRVAHAYPDWPGYDEARIERNSFASRSLTAAESLAGSSFQLSSGARDAAGSFHLWGRGSYSRFDDRHGVLRLGGDVGSMTLGAEFGGDRVLTGVALSHSVGSGSHARGGGASESTLSGIYPYAHLGVNERLRVWGTLGAGSGTLMRSVRDGEWVPTRLSMRMAAVGGRTALRSATAEDRLSLAMDADALLMRIVSDESDHLMAGKVDSSRLRLGLEGSYAIVNEDGELAPYVDLGVRRDGGAGATGLGVEIGGGFRYTHPVVDLKTEFGVHGLVAHEVDDRSEWGMSGSIRYDPHSNTGRGPSFQLTASSGAGLTGDSRALWRRETVSDWLVNGGSNAGVGIDAEFGYGMPLRNGAGTGTPWAGVSLTERTTDVRLGYRIEFGRSVGMGIEGLIRDGTQDGVPSDRAVMLRLSLR